MGEVTQADRDATDRYYSETDPSDAFSGDELAKYFARHREAAMIEGAQLMQDASIRQADEHARLAWKIGEAEKQSSICSSGRNYGARAVGQAIRALDPAEVVRA